MVTRNCVEYSTIYRTQGKESNAELGRERTLKAFRPRLLKIASFHPDPDHDQILPDRYQLPKIHLSLVFAEWLYFYNPLYLKENCNSWPGRQEKNTLLTWQKLMWLMDPIEQASGNVSGLLALISQIVNYKK